MKILRQDSANSGRQTKRFLWIALGTTALATSTLLLRSSGELQSSLLSLPNLAQEEDDDDTAAVSSFSGDMSFGAHSHLAAPFPDSLSCDTMDERVQNGTYIDPNKGAFNIRQVIDRPYFKMSVHNRDYDYMRYDTIFKIGRYYEHAVKKRFDLILSKAAAEKGDKQSVVLDVGANIGYYTMVSAAYGHEVVSFEINPANVIRLCESISINRFDRRVSIFMRGVSSVADQPLRVVIPAHNPGEARMEDPNITTTAKNAYVTETTTITLDQFAQRHGWLKKAADKTPSLSIPLLKLDVEGHEPYIIAGAKQLLCSGLVKNVLLEFNKMHEQASQDAIDILIECNYVAVHHENGNATLTVKTRAETKPYLKEIQEWGKKTRRNIDLWFQLAQI